MTECRVSLVVEMFVRMLHHCGMPMDDVDLIHGNGKVVGDILKTAQVRSTLFTGSAKVAETLAKELQGKVGVLLWRDVAWRGVLCCAVLWRGVLCCAMLCCAVLRCACLQERECKMACLS